MEVALTAALVGAGAGLFTSAVAAPTITHFYGRRLQRELRTTTERLALRSELLVLAVEVDHNLRAINGALEVGAPLQDLKDDVWSGAELKKTISGQRRPIADAAAAAYGNITADLKTRKALIDPRNRPRLELIQTRMTELRSALLKELYPFQH